MNIGVVKSLLFSKSLLFVDLLCGTILSGVSEAASNSLMAAAIPCEKTSAALSLVVGFAGLIVVILLGAYLTIGFADLAAIFYLPFTAIGLAGVGFYEM